MIACVESYSEFLPVVDMTPAARLHEFCRSVSIARSVSNVTPRRRFPRARVCGFEFSIPGFRRFWHILGAQFEDWIIWGLAIY